MHERTHEVYGAGSYMFAFSLMAQRGGAGLWLRAGWDPHQVNPNGFSDFLNPAQLTICNVHSQIETLTLAEETLRSGAVSLVVMQLNKPLGLTEGRRLQLAARDGKSTGLSIMPEGMGSNAAETRWHCMPVFDAEPNAYDSTLQRWELKKNKSGTLGVWYVRWDKTSRRLTMVSPPGK